MKVLILLQLVVFWASAVGCEVQKAAVVAPQPTATPVVVAPVVTLGWEKNHPERKVNTDALVELVEESGITNATDMDFFCPMYSHLQNYQKVWVASEMIVWTAYYESAWDPTAASVDVGDVAHKDTWSVGLMQMSVTDQESYGLKFGYTYDDLKKAIPNLRLAVAVMGQQVKKRGTILIGLGKPGLYWATLHPGGKYDQSAKIKANVLKLEFCH
jgi:hypothetical protein